MKYLIDKKYFIITKSNIKKIYVHCRLNHIDINYILSDVNYIEWKNIIAKLSYEIEFISNKYIYTSLAIYYLEAILFFPKIKSLNHEIIYAQTEYIWDILSASRISSLHGKYRANFGGMSEISPAERQANALMDIIRITEEVKAGKTNPKMLEKAKNYFEKIKKEKE